MIKTLHWNTGGSRRCIGLKLYYDGSIVYGWLYTSLQSKRTNFYWYISKIGLKKAEVEKMEVEIQLEPLILWVSDYNIFQVYIGEGQMTIHMILG